MRHCVCSVRALQLKNFAAAAPLMKFVTLSKLHSQYGKAKEGGKVRVLCAVCVRVCVRVCVCACACA